MKVFKISFIVKEEGGEVIVNKKMKECFTAHAMMHNLFGLGLGVLLVSLFPGLASWWLGLLLIVVALVWDSMKK